MPMAEPVSAPPRKRRRPNCQREAAAAQRDGDHDGQNCQGDIVVEGKPDLVGEHRDEMRRPDAASRDEARARDPQCADAPRAGARARDQTHRRAAGEKTQHAREHDEPQIVVLCDAADHAKHAQGHHACVKSCLTIGGEFFGLKPTTCARFRRIFAKISEGFRRLP